MTFAPFFVALPITWATQQFRVNASWKMQRGWSGKETRKPEHPGALRRGPNVQGVTVLERGHNEDTSLQQ